MELWDLYDENLNKINSTITADDEIPNGFYHLSPEIWIVNENNEVLLIKKAEDYTKRYPGMWCCIGGNLKSNENVKDSIVRIVNEKIGFDVSNSKMIVKDPIKKDPHKYAYITCIIYENVDVNNTHFNDGSSTDIILANKQEQTIIIITNLR